MNPSNRIISFIVKLFPWAGTTSTGVVATLPSLTGRELKSAPKGV